MATKLDELVHKAERIGVIGSPSSTSELALDVMAQAVSKKLVGELAFFRYFQENTTNYALGQITEVRLRNIWHEDPTMRSLIRQRGRVDAVSERQDTHQGEMLVSAVFADSKIGYRPSILGTVPPTGTPICLVDDSVLDEVLAPFQQQLFYLGKVYGSSPKLPLWFKHFGSGSDGAGEAYHLGVFGKTGSGKSVLAKMIMLAYARYPQMGMLVIDPQGEFGKEVRGEQVLGQFALPTKSVLTKLKKPTKVLSVKDLVLDRWELFEQILSESRFFRELQILTRDKLQSAARELTIELRKKATLAKLHQRESFNQAWELLKSKKVRDKIYAKEGSAADRFAEALDEANPDELFRVWLPIAQLFREDRKGAQRVESILRSLFETEPNRRPLMVIDLSIEQANLVSPSNYGPLFSNEADQPDAEPVLWNETIQALVIKRILEGIRTTAERAYGQNRSLNTLVIIDEAHRLAPREEPSNEEQKAVRSILIDAARTTRKYGVGWMFISQTLSSLHREIVEQLRIFFFGFGLSMGSEFKALSELVGSRSNALTLYQLFRDPHSAFDMATREYSFMTIGPVSPLSFSGTPLFLNVFTDVGQFLETNELS